MVLFGVDALQRTDLRSETAVNTDVFTPMYIRGNLSLWTLYLQSLSTKKSINDNVYVMRLTQYKLLLYIFFIYSFVIYICILLPYIVLLHCRAK